MERRTFAVAAVIAGVVMGLLGNMLFYGREIGISFPIYILLSVALVLILGRAARRPVNRRNLWVLLPLAFFAVMVAVRADSLILTLNVLSVLTLGAIGLYYLPTKQAMDTEPLGEHTKGVIEAGILVMPAALAETLEAWAWLREKRHQRGGVLAAVVRGGVFALPVVLVFAVLLGSADAVFASYVNQAFDGVRRALGIEFLGDTMTRTLMIAGFGIAVTGSLGYGLRLQAAPVLAVVPPVRQPDEDSVDETVIVDDKPKAKPGFKLSMVESSIIMGSVVALFAAFVVVQFAYFFGGERTLEMSNLSYAQYARRGFFELVAVSVMTLGLSLILDHVSVRQSKRENTGFRVLALLIVGLTSIMLVSASQRMWLYEEAFGFTQLRVYTHVFMLWLGVLFGFFVLAVFRLRMNIFSLGVVLAIIGYLVTLNVMNVDRYIAERNIARYHDGQELDIAFLNILSPDAVEPILALWQESGEGTEVHTWSGQWLAKQLNTLSPEVKQTGQLPFSLNFSRMDAWLMLDRVSRQLPAYDPSLYWGSYYSSYSESRSDYGSGWDAVSTASPGSR
ncbi:MAG: DUF4173 domain-containing protein [Anaerolineae bacterium]|nr:DUF4173 domain-containing protein [Anaerolineae bacterium]